jgi:hypothetical protein
MNTAGFGIAVAVAMCCFHVLLLHHHLVSGVNCIGVLCVCMWGAEVVWTRGPRYSRLWHHDRRVLLLHSLR